MKTATAWSDHAGAFEDAVVPAFPDHVGVGFVAHQHHVLATDQVGDALQVFEGGNAAGRVVGRVEEDATRLGGFFEEAGDLFQIRPELVLFFERHVPGLGTSAVDVGRIGREVRREDEHRIALVQKRFAEELLQHLGTGHDDDMVSGDVETKLPVVEPGNRFPER